MGLPDQITTREYKKFIEDLFGQVRVAVDGWITNTPAYPVPVSGAFSQSGLNIAGLITPVNVTDSAWTALPTTPLTDRNAISIQNQTDYEIKIQYDGSTSGYIGVIVPPHSERFYDIKENIVLYGRAASGAGTIEVIVEELS